MTRGVNVQKEARSCLIGLLPFALGCVVSFAIEARAEAPTDGRDTRQVGDVRPVDVTGVFREGGTVRCLVNVTRRRLEWDTSDSRANPTRPRAIQRWRLRDLEIDNGIDDTLTRLAMRERGPLYAHRLRARF